MSSRIFQRIRRRRIQCRWAAIEHAADTIAAREDRIQHDYAG
ncbi:hypothetical protein [Streptomyces canus]|nr:hypothetical protein [Streptomyces canus]WSD82943.1 hypothetical protein OG925_00570 [Streptomyces canus]WSD91892.1 hypothetical protein OG925_49910 [Streptomyces canus]WSD92619.1 hypothetical protein OG925_51050 [Streptomyces canus]